MTWRVVGVVGLALGAGCGLTLDLNPPVVGVDGAGVDAAGPDGGMGIDAPDAFMRDTGLCTVAADCVRDPTLPDTDCMPQCVAGACVPADEDGDGLGPGCEVPFDCDDFDPDIGRRALIPCRAAPGACGLGAARLCVDDTVTECIGAREGRDPSELSEEFCNGIDDDCDGTVDEDVAGDGTEFEWTAGCSTGFACTAGRWQPIEPPVAGDVDLEDGLDNDCDGSIDEDWVPQSGECVFVGGGDMEGEATNPARPLRTIEEALALIRADELLPRQICLLAENNMGLCEETYFQTPAASIPAGVIIHGDMYFNAGAVVRCTGGTTILAAPEGASIRFDPSGAIAPGTPTGLRNLHVLHSEGGRQGIEVEGMRSIATPVSFENISVRTINLGLASIAVAESVLRIADSHITGRTDGVHAQGGAEVQMLGACGTLDRCTCQAPHDSIVRSNGNAIRTDARAVVLTRGYALCGTGLSALVDGTHVAVRTHFAPTSGIATDGDTNSVLVHGRLIMSRSQVTHLAAGPGEAVRVSGPNAQAVLFESTIASGGRAGPSIVGLRCELGGQCGVHGSTLTGWANVSGATAPATRATAMSCDRGSLCGITESTLVGSSGAASVALAYEATGGISFLDRSVLRGGCAGQSIGVSLEGGVARLENNEISGGLDCRADDPTRTSTGMRVSGTASVDSVYNSIDAGDVCDLGVGLDDTTTGLTSYRGTLFSGGMCTRGTAARLSSFPALFVHDAFIDAVEFEERHTDAPSLESISPFYFGHVFGDLDVFNDRPTSLRIRAGSAPDGAGAVDAPPLDLPGRSRPSPPSIGCYEP